MPNLNNVERKIATVEGFEVTIRHTDGRDMRSDKEGFPSYPYHYAARNEFAVALWRDQRFKQVYVG